jgi:hypothetical protein
MRSAIRCLTCVALTLWASPASAQPLFHEDRDWTVEVGGLLYGFRDVVQTPGEFRWARVWIAGRPFDPAHRPPDRWVLAVPTVPAVFVARHLTRPGPAAGR